MTTIEFNNLVYTSSKSLKYPALKLTKNQKDDANDLIQDTLVKALRYKNNFKPGTNIKAWLYVIMRNTFISKYHTAKRSTVLDPIEDEHSFVTPSTIDYNDGASNVVLDDINKAINKLENCFKEPFMLHFKGFKYEEIAEKLNAPMGTIKNRIHVARKILMQELKDYKI